MITYFKYIISLCNKATQFTQLKIFFSWKFSVKFLYSKAKECNLKSACTLELLDYEVSCQCKTV